MTTLTVTTKSGKHATHTEFNTIQEAIAFLLSLHLVTGEDIFCEIGKTKLIIPFEFEEKL